MIGVKLLERYELVEQIGHGGMGVVYRARDPLLDREVAVKMLPPGALRPDTEERFRREARLVAQMDHPGIVPIFDFGHYLGSLFLVMPVVEGTTLRKLTERGGLHLGEVLEIAAQSAEALEYSHARGVVHRDIKPDNIMVSLESEPMRVRLMDFGLARDTGHGKLTHSGGIVGTISYMSPEQIQGGAVGVAADIYGLGAVLYECLAGEAPFVGPLYSLVPRIVAENPPALRVRSIEVDEELDALVLSCLAKDPAARPKTGRELANGLRRAAVRLGGEALRRLIATPATAGPAPNVPLVGRQVELQQILARLQLVMAGDAQTLMIEGEAGLGKSRLLDEIAALCRSRGLRVVRGRLADRASTLPYQGFCELVQDALRTRDTSMSSSGNLLELAELAGDLVSRFPLLAEVDELRSLAAEKAEKMEKTGEAGEPASAGPLEIAQLFARTLQKITGGRPFAILLEDIHLASEPTAETLERFATFLAKSPVLLAASLRPSEVEAGSKAARLLSHWKEDPRTTRLRLEPLAGDDFARLVGLHLGIEEPPSDLIERLFAASEGNPLFVRELIRAWCDTSELRRGVGGSWTFSGSRALLSGDALPQAVKEAVERHLDRLPAPHRRLLELAAVLGPRFDFDDLVALLSETGLPGVDSAMVGAMGLERLAEKMVEALLQAGVLVEERRGFLCFASLLQREVLYHRLSRRERRACHRRVAEHLLRRFAGREDKALAAIFHHAAEGEMAAITEQWGLELARRALAGSQAEEAVKVARKALEAEGEEGGDAGHQRGELQRTLAEAERLQGNLDGAIDAAERAFTAFDRRGEPAAAARAAHLLAEIAWQARRGELARAWVERGLELARAAAAGEREPALAETLEKLLLLGATVTNLRGEHEEARRYFDELERRGRQKTADQRFEEGGILRIAFTSRDPELDPVQAASREELEVGALLYDVLIERAGEMQSPLLESAFLSADGRRCELRLRAGLAFSDGAPVGAVAVKRSLERAARGRRGRLPAALAVLDGIEEFLRGQEDEIRGLDVIGERALLCELSEPLPIFPALLSDPTLALVREAADPAGNKRLFGTGPFVLDAAEPRHLLLSRRRSPGGARSARLDHLEIELGVESPAMLAALRAGELDLGGDLPSEEIEALLRDPRLRAGYIEQARQNVVCLLLRPALPAPEREALAAALGAFGLVQSWGRLAQPAFGLLPPGVLGHNAGRRPLQFAADPARLAGRRWRAGIHRRLLARHRAFFERLGHNLEKCGATLEWQEMDSPPRSDRADFDLLFLRATAASDDPDELAFGLFHSRRGRLRAYISSDELDALLEEGRLETRPLQRGEIYRKIEEELLASGLFLPLFHEIDGRVAGPRVRGLRLSPRPPFIDYGRLAIGEAEQDPFQRPGRGGEIHVPLPGRPQELDPLLGLWSDFVEILPNVFETLVRVEEGARPEPLLAQGWEARGGGARYHFHLRPGVRFHDGRRFSSRDVRWSFERLLRSPRSEAHFPLLPIKGARAFRDGAAQIAGLQLLSSHEVLIELERPIAFFPCLLSHPLTAIVAEGTHFLDGTWRDGCVGTGPFRVLRFEPQRRLELERNPDYWRVGFPKADRLSFHFGADATKVAGDFRQGRLSLASDLTPEEIDSLRRDPEFAAGYRETPRLATYFLLLDPRHPPFSDRNQRRELAAALNLGVSLQAAGRLAVRAHGLIPPGLLGYEAPAPLPALPPAEPIERPKVFVRVIKHPVYAGPYAKLWQQLKDGAQSAGFDLDEVELQPGQATIYFRDGGADLLAFRWVADYPDTDGFLANLLHGEEGALGKALGLPELDRQIERARSETDPGLRHVLYREIDEKLVHEVLVVPLFHEQIYRFRHPSVRGFRFGTSTPEVRYDELYVRR